jgi:hypothetical protein
MKVASVMVGHTQRLCNKSDIRFVVLDTWVSMAVLLVMLVGSHLVEMIYLRLARMKVVY